MLQHFMSSCLVLTPCNKHTSRSFTPDRAHHRYNVHRRFPFLMLSSFRAAVLSSVSSSWLVSPSPPKIPSPACCPNYSGETQSRLLPKAKLARSNPSHASQVTDHITMSITHALDRKLVSYQSLTCISYSSQPIETASRVPILIPKAQTKPSLPQWLTTASYPRQPAYDCPFSLHP